MHSATRIPTLAALTIALLLSACGRKDDPLPPLRYIPVPARDLSLHQQGGVLILNMAYPQTTTSGQTLPGLDAVHVWWLQLPEGASSPEVEPRTFEAQAEELFQLSGAELTSSVVGDRIETRFPVPEQISEGSKVVWAVRSVSSTGEVSPFSNQAGLDYAARLAAPGNLHLTAENNGVRIDWSTSEDANGSHVYRRLATERQFGAPLERIAKDENTFLDETAQYGQRYIYTLRAIAVEEPLVESDASAETEINYRDTFAPEPPRSVLGLGEQGGVRLVLEASPSSDTVGYLVFRQDPQASFKQVTEDPVPSLEYLDTGLTPGLSYIYYVTAVDSAGNEGMPSTTVTVTVPE